MPQYTSVINMGGITFPIKSHSTSKFPTSRISKIYSLFFQQNGREKVCHDICESFDKETGEVTFKRLPSVATTIILKMIQEGEIHYGHENVNVCAIAFKKELEFWQIPVSSMEQCCKSEFLDACAAANTQAQRVKFVRETKQPKVGSLMWRSFHYIQMIFSLLINFLYIFALCQDSVRDFKMMNGQETNNNTTEKGEFITAAAVSYVTGACVVFFFLQTLGHAAILVMYSERRTAKNIILIISDVLGLVPVLLHSILDFKGDCNTETAVSACRVFGSLTGFVTMRVVRFSPFLQLVFFSILASWKEIVQFAMLLFTFSAILAGFSLYIEIRSNLVDPMEAFYFAVVSLLTVGYDHAPVSTELKMLVSIVLILWLISSTICLGIIMSNVSNISDTMINADKIKRKTQEKFEARLRTLSKSKATSIYNPQTTPFLGHVKRDDEI